MKRALYLDCNCLSYAKNTNKVNEFGVILTNPTIYVTNKSSFKARSLPKSSEQSDRAWISNLLDLLELQFQV